MASFLMILKKEKNLNKIIESHQTPSREHERYPDLSLLPLPVDLSWSRATILAFTVISSQSIMGHLLSTFHCKQLDFSHVESTS